MTRLVILKQILWLNWKVAVFALTKKTFLVEPAEDCPVDSILLFVDIL